VKKKLVTAVHFGVVIFPGPCLWCTVTCTQARARTRPVRTHAGAMNLLASLPFASAVSCACCDSRKDSGPTNHASFEAFTARRARSYDSRRVAASDAAWPGEVIGRSFSADAAVQNGVAVQFSEVVEEGTREQEQPTSDGARGARASAIASQLVCALPAPLALASMLCSQSSCR